MKGKLFPFINNVDSCGGESGGKDVFGEEGLSEAETGCDGADNGDERIPDGNFSYGIAGEQLVVEGKPDGGDTNEHKQVEQSEQGNIRERAT